VKLVAIDFETANYDADSACALGIAVIENGRITESEARLIRPPQRNFVFTHIHGITWDDVEQEHPFHDVWDDFYDYWTGADYLVAHNAPFDRRVLTACCLAGGRKIPTSPFVCTVRVARSHWNFRPANLSYVCSQLGTSLQHHDAASDALACASIAARAIMEGFPIHTAVLGTAGKLG
jgi:DNA polymerase-3 subunit epsilon